MKLQDLHVLMTVVQAGSMRKAATVLNTSQPAISRSIADLEHAVGVRLLDRNPQGVGPTAYGRVLLDGGRAMFDELHQAVKGIELLTDPTAGEVRIGSSAPLAAGVLTAVIERLSSRYPRMHFHVVEGYIAPLQRRIARANIDLAIGSVREPIAVESLESFSSMTDWLWRLEWTTSGIAEKGSSLPIYQMSLGFSHIETALSFH
jgi:DNA-binding transcriptional LysR family regulator